MAHRQTTKTKARCNELDLAGDQSWTEVSFGSGQEGRGGQRWAELPEMMTEGRGGGKTMIGGSVGRPVRKEQRNESLQMATICLLRLCRPLVRRTPVDT